MSDDSDSGAGYSSHTSSDSSSNDDTMQPPSPSQLPLQSQSQRAAASFLPLSVSAAAAASSVDAMASSSIRPMESPTPVWSPPSGNGAGAGGWSSSDSLTDSTGSGLFSSSDEDDEQPRAHAHAHAADSDADAQVPRTAGSGAGADDEKDGRWRGSGASASLAAIMRQHALLQPQAHTQEQAQLPQQPPPQPSHGGPVGDLSTGVGDLPPFRHLPASVYSQHLPWMHQSRAAESNSATAAASLPLTAENLKYLGGHRFSGGYYGFGGMLNCESCSSSESGDDGGAHGDGCGSECSCGGSACSSVCSCVCSLGEACLCCNADVLADWEAEEDLAQLDTQKMLVATFDDADFKNQISTMVAQTLVGVFAPRFLPHVYRLLGVDWATKPSLMQPSLEQL